MGTISLTSPYQSFRVTLEPPVEERSERFGLRVVQPAKTLKFKGGKCDMPEEWLPLLQQAPCYTGMGRTPKTVFIMSEVSKQGSGGPRVVTGALGSADRPKVDPPLPEWDELSGTAIVEALRSGQIKDPAAALAFEASRRKRGPVMVALANAAAGDDGEPLAAKPTRAPQAKRLPEGQEVA